MSLEKGLRIVPLSSEGEIPCVSEGSYPLVARLGDSVYVRRAYVPWEGY